MCCCHEKQDARSLSKEVQQYNRDQAVRLFKKGKTRREIVDIIEVNYSAVCNWITAWRKGGQQAIVLKKRGRTSESQKLLTEAQEKALEQLLIDKNPMQLKLQFAPWNRKAIQSAVYKIWRVKIAIRTIVRLHEAMGFYTAKTGKKSV